MPAVTLQTLPSCLIIKDDFLGYVRRVYLAVERAIDGVKLLLHRSTELEEIFRYGLAGLSENVDQPSGWVVLAGNQDIKRNRGAFAE